MEDTLRVISIITYWTLEGVLILVLMEDTLRVFTIFVTLIRYSLNPCFNGRYSQSKWANNVMNIRKVVLILVLMEDTLRAQRLMRTKRKQSLNPCFNGRYSQRNHRSSQ